MQIMTTATATKEELFKKFNFVPKAILNATPMTIYPAKKGFGDEATPIPHHSQICFGTIGAKFYIQMHLFENVKNSKF